jgi:hypothetical protein
MLISVFNNSSNFQDTGVVFAVDRSDRMGLPIGVGVPLPSKTAAIATGFNQGYRHETIAGFIQARLQWLRGTRWADCTRSVPAISRRSACGCGAQ